jgi:hypothetical protein
MSDATDRPFRLAYHVIIAIAVGLIAPFTGFAWPFALLTGMVISRDDRDRRTGTKVPAAARIIRVLAVTGGVLAMLFAGAILGGLIAFSIVWLVTVSERMSADATPNDRTIARLLLVIGAVVGFVVGGMLLDMNVSIAFGS